MGCDTVYFGRNILALRMEAKYSSRSGLKMFVILFTEPYTYLLTPCTRVLLVKLTGFAASQEIPHIFRTRRFITVLTSARHQSLSWANSIQSSQPPPTSWRSILILSPICVLVLVLVLLNKKFREIKTPQYGNFRGFIRKISRGPLRRGPQLGN